MKRLTLMILIVIFGACSRTPGIAEGSASIAVLEHIEVNGDDQFLSVRGNDTSNPVLLFLHGGPGMPMMYMAHEFGVMLEAEFVVVHWDQRNSGKSLKKTYDPALINVRQYMDDALAVIDYLKKRFNQQRIILAGHSWGSYLGTLLISERPELFQAYVGIGQVVDSDQTLLIQEEFLTSTAQERGDENALEELDELGKRAFEKYLFQYGGELKKGKSYMPFVWSGLKSPEYSFRDVFKVAKGSGICSTHMKYNVINGSILDKKTRFEIPVFYFTGTNDYTTPFSLIEKYFEKVEAPFKALVWFNESAHFPFFEEPDKFYDEMVKVKNVGRR